MRRFKFLFFALPIGVHFLIHYGYYSIALVVIYCILLVASTAALRRSRVVFSLLALVVITGMVAGLYWLGETYSAIYLPSIVLPIIFCAVFTFTLLPGQTPMITHLAVTWRKGDFPPEGYRYTRGVTLAWTVFFLFLSLEALALALWTPIEVWSLFANVLNYLFIIAFFLLEYLFRKIILKSFQITPFFEYLRFVFQVERVRKAR